MSSKYLHTRRNAKNIHHFHGKDKRIFKLEQIVLEKSARLNLDPGRGDYSFQFSKIYFQDKENGVAE